MSLSPASNMIMSGLLQPPEYEWPLRTRDVSKEAHINAVTVDFAAFYMRVHSETPGFIKLWECYHQHSIIPSSWPPQMHTEFLDWENILFSHLSFSLIPRATIAIIPLLGIPKSLFYISPKVLVNHYLLLSPKISEKYRVFEEEFILITHR